MKPLKKNYFPSEIRQDPTTGDWVIINSGRFKRPGGKIVAKKRKHLPLSRCPFEDPIKTGHGEPLFIIKKSLKGEWSTMVIKNKFPAVLNGPLKVWNEGLHKIITGVGEAEIVLTRDHKKSLAQLGLNAVKEFLLAYLNRFRALSQDPKTEFIMGFMNYGPTAGASISHPHGQIISLPIIPPAISNQLKTAAKYYYQKKRCLYCDLIKWERKEKKRVIKENKKFISVCPYTSKNAYQINIYPLKHQPDFKMLETEDIELLAEVLLDALSRLFKLLKDPDYNLMIHSGPIKKSHPYFHWHLELIPRTELPAGFELGTGMEICGLDPDIASRQLKKIKIKNG